MTCHARITRDPSGYPACSSSDHEDDHEAMECAGDRGADSLRELRRDLWPFLWPLVAVAGSLVMTAIVVGLYLGKPAIAAWLRSW